MWQRDGRALYYVDPKGRLRKVSVRQTAAGELSLTEPVELPITVGSGHSNTQYDVAPDGRIYYLDPTPPRLPTEIRIVLGWQRAAQVTQHVDKNSSMSCTYSVHRSYGEIESPRVYPRIAGRSRGLLSMAVWIACAITSGPVFSPRRG